MKKEYTPLLLLFLTVFILLFAEEKSEILNIPDSINTQVETLQINVNNGSRINLSNRIGVNFTLVDSVEAKFNHITENGIKHYWQYIFNLRGGTVNIEYENMEHAKKNVHIQTSESDLLIPKKNTFVKINRLGMTLSAEKENKEIAIKMDHNFDTSSVIDSLKEADLVVLSDIPIDPAMLSESLSDDMKIYMPVNNRSTKSEIRLDSLKEEHCLRIVVLLNRDDEIADTIMKLCHQRIAKDTMLAEAKVESDIFLGNIEDMVEEKSKESLLPDEIFEKKSDYDSRIIDSASVLKTETDITTLSTGYELSGGLIFIKGGEFEMGSDNDIGNLDEYPKHKVIVSDFYIDETEVTVSEYNKVLNISSSESDRCPKCPITNVNYYEAHHYCFNIGKRLPTEAEWEYAARAGTKTLFYTGNTLSPEDANFDTRRAYGTYGKTDYIQKPVAVMSYKPNFWGLFDMIGNVGEWCDDWYSKTYYSKNSDFVNPKGPEEGTYKVIRGGTWASPGIGLRSAKRYGYNPNVRMQTIGFRCAKDIKKKQSIDSLGSKSVIQK